MSQKQLNILDELLNLTCEQYSNNKECSWISSLKTADKIEVYCERDDFENKWHIATITKILTDQSCNVIENILVTIKEQNKKYQYTEYEEIINIEDTSSVDQNIAKLHTHTHSYRLQKCYKCGVSHCLECDHLKYIRYRHLCRNCVISREEDDRFYVIRCSNIGRSFGDKIAKIIAVYSIGFIIICSNNECMNEISIDNQFDWRDKTRYKYSYYSIHEKYIHQYARDNLFNIYGSRGWDAKYLRFICDQCPKQNCDLLCCPYHEVSPNGICDDHAICSICNNKICDNHPNDPCKGCKQRNICENTQFYHHKKPTPNRDICELCIIPQEEKHIFDIIKDGNIVCTENDKIAWIIAGYSIGYILNCSNDDCDNEINIDNRYECLQQLRDNYSLYSVDKTNRSKHNNKIIDVYEKYLKFTCHGCRYTNWNKIMMIKNYLIYGFCRSYTTLIICDIIDLIIKYCNFNDKWSMKMSSSLVRVTSDIIKMRKKIPSTKQFAFGNDTIIINETSKLQHAWKLQLGAINRYPPKEKHICCGIGICNVDNIETLRVSYKLQDVVSKHDFQQSLHAEFIGFECLFCDNFEHQRNQHCINDWDLIKSVEKAELSSDSLGKDGKTCFMNHDTVVFYINCKQKIMSIYIMNRYRKYHDRKFVKCIKKIKYGKYRLAVWLKDVKERIKIIDSFVISE